MSDEIEPSVQGGSDAYLLAQVIYRGALTDWIQPGDVTLIADFASNIDAAELPLDAFDLTHSGSSLTATVETGEGFVGGAYVATDETHDVTLEASTTNQTIYVGWDADATNALIVGTEAAFDSEDPKLLIWTVSTDANGVTNADDERPLGEQTNFDQLTAGSDSEFDRFLAIGRAATPIGTAGDVQGELFRAPGAVSDLVFATETGQESAAITYNAYLDSGTWKSIVGGQDCYRLGFGPNGTEISHYPAASADETISWQSLAVDTGSVYIDGTKIYDNQTGEVPQIRLGGAASFLGSYPIPPDDLDGTFDGGQNGDVLTSDGNNAYWASGGGGGGSGLWTEIESFEDVDTGTPLDFDTGVMSPTYDLYRIETVYVNHDASANQLRMRLNGDATTSYTVNGTDYETGSITRVASRSEFQRLAETDVDELGQFEATIRGNEPTGATGETVNYPTATFDVAGTASPGTDPSDFMAQNGRLRSAHATVDEIYVWSVGDATASLNVLGRNL